MGCTSSTPFVSSGSTMLRAASNVATDATKSAEDAIGDATQTLGKTIDAAKESVGTAVTGIAQELGNAIKEKTEETKTNLMEKLHLNNGHERESSDAAEALMKQGATGHSGIGHDDDEDEGNDDSTQRISRGPTPTAMQQETDSLKTMVSEPEIEQALANRNENSPPTPKPSISELELLSAELNELKTDASADAIQKMSGLTAEKSEILLAEETTTKQEIQHRPNTTEWERYADLLAKDQKFHPNEIALRRRLLGSQVLPAATTATLLSATETGTTGTETATAGGTVASASAKAVAMTTMPSTSVAMKSISRTQSKTSIHPPQYFRDFPRSNADVNRQQNDEESGCSDRNNGSNSSPVLSNRYAGPRLTRKRIPRSSTTINAKKMHRQLTSLIGFSSDRVALPGTRAFGGNKSSNILFGRNFDFNPNRTRVGSPIIRRRNNQTLLPLRFGDAPRLANRLGNRIGSPIKVAPIKQRSRLAFGANTPTPLVSSSSSPSRIGLNSLGRINSASIKRGTRSLSRSSRSSTNNSIAIKSNCTTPISRSPLKNSLINTAVGAIPNNIPMIPDSQHVHYPLRSLSRSSSPLPGLAEDFRFGDRHMTPLGTSRSPINNKNTSSFLSSPRTSPFSVRKSYTEYENKENKSVFVADLSSVVDNRNLLTPSPYKMRERCAVCFNKYIVK